MSGKLGYSIVRICGWGWGVNTEGIINLNPAKNVSPLMTQCGPETSSINIISELVRNADSQSISCILTRSPRYMVEEKEHDLKLV